MERKEILPTWIRFFSWIFLIFSVTPLFFVYGLLFEGNYKLTMCGLSYEGSTTMHPVAFYITGLITLAAVVAYGILWGRDWAIKLGIFYSILALLTNAYVLVVSANSGHTYIPLDPLLLVPFLIILIQRKERWETFENAPSPEIPQDDSTTPIP